MQSVADSQGVSSHGLTFILLIDCYSTHTCVEFVAFFKNYYNGVDNAKGFLVFTPPGLTFTANPADLTVQSKTKGLLKQMSAYSIAKSFLEQKDLDSRLSILKPQLLEWLVLVVKYWKSPEGKILLQKGFTLAGLDRIFDSEFQTKAFVRRFEVFPLWKDSDHPPPAVPPIPQPDLSANPGPLSPAETEEDLEDVVDFDPAIPSSSTFAIPFNEEDFVKLHVQRLVSELKDDEKPDDKLNENDVDHGHDESKMWLNEHDDDDADEGEDDSSAAGDDDDDEIGDVDECAGDVNSAGDDADGDEEEEDNVQHQKKRLDCHRHLLSEDDEN